MDAELRLALAAGGMTTMTVFMFFGGAFLIIVGMAELFGWPGAFISVGVVCCVMAMMDAAGVRPYPTKKNHADGAP